MTDATEILSQIEQGDPSRADQLLPLVYTELRRLAEAKLAREKPGQTLQPTALVHEAYMRLVDTERAQHWDSRGHFFSAAAESIRRILVERARRKARVKHGGNRNRIDLDKIVAIASTPDDELLALDEAIARLSKVAPDKAEVVKLRYFAGMTIPEVAEALRISPATVERYWGYARVWLYAELHDEDCDATAHR